MTGFRQGLRATPRSERVQQEAPVETGVVAGLTHEGEGVLRLAPTEIPQFRSAGFVSRPQGEWVDFAV